MKTPTAVYRFETLEMIEQAHNALLDSMNHALKNNEWNQTKIGFYISSRDILLGQYQVFLAHPPLPYRHLSMEIGMMAHRIADLPLELGWSTEQGKMILRIELDEARFDAVAIYIKGLQIVIDELLPLFKDLRSFAKRTLEEVARNENYCSHSVDFNHERRLLKAECQRMTTRLASFHVRACKMQPTREQNAQIGRINTLHGMFLDLASMLEHGSVHIMNSVLELVGKDE